MLTDEELMLAVASGDLAALAQLVTRYQGAAWNAAYRFLGNTADAEDVAQEAFLRILAAANRYRPTASFRTYLYRVVTHLCFDLARRRRLRRRDQLSDVPDPGISPEEASVVRERANFVRLALDSLPEAQKMAVILRYYEDLSYREIAGALKTSVKGVERLLARARDHLEHRLSELSEE
ncbi:MAG: RNA polymerase sigma factor [Pirellulaceae bacterium]